MNEVTKIHLGRQAFTVSVDAYGELRRYLDEITKQVGDKDVVDEVELRMAELLMERGVKADSVILATDVTFLKEQLGDPQDFKEDGDEPPVSQKVPETKRLFRDTDNAMIAGVAAGLAKYFGVDVVLMRVAFVVLAFITLGWSILLYIALWLLVPEARSSSDRLQMAGKPVTVGSLKEIVENADVKGAAHRANAALVGPVRTIFGLILKVVGLVFILGGLSMLFGLMTGLTYFLVRGGAWLNIFPVGFSEHLLLYITLLVSGLIALFVTLFGVAMFRQKWPLPAWVTGVLIGLVFIGGAVGGALAVDTYPDVRAAYYAHVHVTTRPVQPFTHVEIRGEVDVPVDYQVADTYYVTLTYFDHPDLGAITTRVENGALVIDGSRYDWHRSCNGFCIPDTYDMSITVHSPNAMQLQAIPALGIPDKPIPPDEQ